MNSDLATIGRVLSGKGIVKDFSYFGCFLYNSTHATDYVTIRRDLSSHVHMDISSNTVMSVVRLSLQPGRNIYFKASFIIGFECN